MSQQSVPAPKKRLGKGKKIAVAVGALIATPPLIVGVVHAANLTATHDTSAASHRTPTANPKQAPTTPASPPGPAQSLSDLDGIGRPAAQYQQVLDALAPRCKENLPHLTKVVTTTLKTLQQKGVKDEDAFSVLQHLEQQVTPGKPRINCASAATTYATQREGSQ